MVHNRGRFLSVFFIVALGAAFFSGLRSSRRDMLLSADAYFDRTNLMDLRVIGSLGLTDDDLADIRGLEGVHAAFGLCSVDVLCRGEQDWAVRLMSFEMGVNSPVVVSGRVPLEQDECLVDAAFARAAPTIESETRSTSSLAARTTWNRRWVARGLPSSVLAIFPPIWI